MASPNLWSDLRGTQVSTMTVGVSQVTTYVQNEVISAVYGHRQRVPDNEEFLLCSKETTLEVPGFADLGMGQASRRLRCVLKTWNIW